MGLAGVLVYRLGHGPLKAERRVRFPCALPILYNQRLTKILGFKKGGLPIQTSNSVTLFQGRHDYQICGILASGRVSARRNTVRVPSVRVRNLVFGFR